MAKENGLTANSRDEENTDYGQAGPNLQTQMHKAARRQAPATARPVAGAQPTGLGGEGPPSTWVTVHCAEPQPLSGPGVGLNPEQRDWSPSSKRGKRR